MPQLIHDHRYLVGFVVVTGILVIRRLPRFTAWIQKLELESLFRSRLQYLALGLLLSEMGLGFLNHALVRQLDALVTLGLGILGLLLGLQFSEGGTSDRRMVQAAGLETTATLVLVSGPFFFLLEGLTSLGWQERAMAAALVGCAASISGRRLFLADRMEEDHPLAPLNRVADFSTVFGVLAAGMLLAVLSTHGEILNPYERLLTFLAIGVVGGLGAWLLASETRSGALRTALLLGVILVTAGTAAHLSLPPVAATLVMGLTIARLPGSLAGELSNSISFLESPLRVLLLVMAGAALPVMTSAMVITVAIYLALRTAGKVLGGRVASTYAHDLLPEKMGLGLLPSSAVAVGLALDFQATAPPEIAGVVVTTAVLGSLLSETAGVWTAQALARALKISNAALHAVSDVTVVDEQPQERVR